MKTAALGTFVFIALVSVTQADVLYQFDVNGADSIQPFSFSFTSPTFAVDGTSLSFAPFAATVRMRGQWCRAALWMDVLSLGLVAHR